MLLRSTPSFRDNDRNGGIAREGERLGPTLEQAEEETVISQFPLTQLCIYFTPVVESLFTIS